MSDSSDSSGDNEEGGDDGNNRFSQESGVPVLALGPVLGTPVALDYDVRTVGLITPRMATSFVWEFFGKYPEHIAFVTGVVNG